MITTFIFDLGEVIFRGFQGVEKLISKELGIPIISSLFQTEELQAFFHGTITEDEMLRRMIDRFGWHTTVHHLRRIIRSNFERIPGTMDIVKGLKRRHYRLGILSVHGREWIEYLEREYRFQHFFDSIEISCYSGVCKPDSFAFECALNALQEESGHCLFVDDSLVNIRAANRCGIKTHLFESAKLLRYDLEELDVM